MLGLFEHSTEQFNTALPYALRIKDPALRADVLYNIYDYKWYNFENIDKQDSMHAMQKKCLELMPDRPLIYVKIADRFIRENMSLDSVKFYLDKTKPLTKTPVAKGFIALTYGQYYEKIEDNKTALNYYIEALSVFEKIRHKSQVRDIYKLISDAYRYLGGDRKSRRIFKINILC